MAATTRAVVVISRVALHAHNMGAIANIPVVVSVSANIPMTRTKVS